MILETLFQTSTGEACLIDFFSMRPGGKNQPYKQIIRILELVSGTIKFKIDIVPRFDYGNIKPWIRRYKLTSFIAMGSNNGLLISGDISLDLKNPHQISKVFNVRKNKKYFLSIMYCHPENLDESSIEVPSIDELNWRLSQAEDWWLSWFSQGKISEPYAKLVSRSALVLKALSYAPTGAIAAAATTSLPESLEGYRNWDYRYSWIRDSYFSVQSLIRLGFVKEAEGFSRFIIRSSHSSVDGLQTLFGVTGETRLVEYTLEYLKGYAGIKPVRIGNDAVKQLQFDIYGELLDLTWNWYNRGFRPDDDFWSFLIQIINFINQSWLLPDYSIWEIRGEPHHYVFSKVMCWVTIDRGIKLAENLSDKNVPIDSWKKTRDTIYTIINENGYNQERGIFVQAFDVAHTDASLLLLPLLGFIDFKDEKMIRTTDAIWQELQIDGLMLRYPHNTDGIPYEEGAFIACSFWLVIALAKQGRINQAQQLFDQAIATSNELGLFSEEFDTKNRRMLGNYPQGLTHMSLIAAVIALQSKV
jgi:GH15 family glucan-1,4-alpha-glucosidase